MFLIARSAVLRYARTFNSFSICSFKNAESSDNACSFLSTCGLI